MLRVIILLVIFLPHVAYAQIGLAGIDGNSDQPIDIVSDTLTVNSQKNIAVFKGDVEAQQGTLTLKSDKMKVFYNNDSSKENNSLSKIITTGHTHLTVPDKQAKSNNGIYDVDKGIILLQGNVVLTKGENKLQGDNFVYNVKNGKSKITSKKIPSKGTAGEKPKKQRVKGVFIPNKKPESK